MPFRSAYQISGRIVHACIEEGQILESLPLESYRKYSGLFGEDLYDAIDLKTAVNSRSSKGGTSKQSVMEQIAWVKDQIQKIR